MSTTRFKSTIDALSQGANKLPADKATANIEGWEEYLSKHDHEGVKKVTQDLGKLKKLLHASAPDKTAIQALLQKLGKDTTAVAGDEDSATAKHIKELGAALTATR